MYAVGLLSTLDWLARLSSRRWEILVVLLLPVTIAAVLSWHFYRSFNTHVCYNWAFDGHNKEILKLINRDRERNFPGRIVNLGNSWLLEPSLNFYRVTRNYTWLAPVTRMPISDTKNDYIYEFMSEVKDIPVDHHILLAYYPDTHTILLRVAHAHGP